MKKIFKPLFWEKKNHPFSFILYPITFIYFLLTLLNKTKIFFAPNLKIKVICVGNIYLGGGGKTPLVKKIYESLTKENKCCIIKKFRISQMDEIKFLKKDSEIITPKNRLQGLKEAELKGYSTAVLDDGMQDYSFKKNISILCIKSNKKFGNNNILPSGPLRESLKNIKNYNIAVINGKEDKNLDNLVIKHNPKIKIFNSYYKIKNIETLKNLKFLAFSGIADNNSFFELLNNNNLNIIDTIEFKDHHNFSENDLQSLLKESSNLNASLITTEKNYSNINEKFQKNIYYTELDLIIKNYEKFLNEIN